MCTVFIIVLCKIGYLIFGLHIFKKFMNIQLWINYLYKSNFITDPSNHLFYIIIKSIFNYYKFNNILLLNLLLSFYFILSLYWDSFIWYFIYSLSFLLMIYFNVEKPY